MDRHEQHTRFHNVNNRMQIYYNHIYILKKCCAIIERAKYIEYDLNMHINSGRKQNSVVLSRIIKRYNYVVNRRGLFICVINNSSIKHVIDSVNGYLNDLDNVLSDIINKINNINIITLSEYAYENIYDLTSIKDLAKKKMDLIKPAIKESYARRTMHPRNLQPLLDDLTINIDDFMTKYVEGL